MGFCKINQKIEIWERKRTNEPVAWIQGLCNLRMAEFDREEWEFDWGFDELRLNGRVAKFDGVIVGVRWEKFRWVQDC